MKTIKTLARYINGYWKDVTITWICVFLESLLEILVAFFLRYLMRNVENGNLQGIILWACILILMAVISAAFGLIAGIFASSASCGFGKNIREAMFIHVQDYSFQNIDHFSTSSIVTRLTTDVSNVQNSLMQILRSVLRAPLMVIFAVIMCFITAPGLAWIFLIIIPILLFALLFIATKVHPIFERVFTTYDQLNESVQEDVDGIRVVKSFERKDYHVSHFKKVSDYIYKNFISAEARLAFNNPILNLCVYASIILISFLGSNIIINSANTELKIPDLTTLFTYIVMIMMSLMMLSMIYVMIIISRNSAERIVEIISEKPAIYSKENAVKEVKDGRVEFQDVSFSYNGKKDVLSHVNLTFESGKSYGIIGPTGSSKTTLVSLMARLYDVREGAVKISGIDVRDYDLVSLRDSVAVVLQKNVLFTGTIRDNLRWGKADASDEEIFKACDIAQASEFIKSFPNGLDTMIVEGGNNVSGGQKQRLCIARALLKNPKIIILDDSTSACDTHTDSLIRKGLKETKPEVTKFIIAQRVLSIMDCDKILVLDSGGKIIDFADHNTLLERCDVYQGLYRTQLGGGDFDETANA